jgi:predicted GNAT family N-acyltransferase
VLQDLALDALVYDRQGFDCGLPALNQYISPLAEQHRRRGISSIDVLTASAQPERILGYYRLSAAEVDVQRLTEAERKKLPRFPVPCFRMGRLACRSDEQGLGLGKLLLGCAVDRCLKAKQQVADA